MCFCLFFHSGCLLVLLLNFRRLLRFFGFLIVYICFRFLLLVLCLFFLCFRCIGLSLCCRFQFFDFFLCLLGIFCFLVYSLVHLHFRFCSLFLLFHFLFLLSLRHRILLGFFRVLRVLLFFI